jgi:DNA mismatch repair protein MutL
VQLGPGEATALGDHLADLSAFGFDLEAFGSDAFLVRGVPADLAGADASGVVKDLAEELSGESGVTSVEKLRERVAVMLSCRSAIKAGDSLSFDEMTELLGALVATARPYTCPHGWPIVMTISNFEIDRKFNR